MATVQHTQLHLFERHHISHQFSAGFFPLRTTGNEIVFNHPLAERLAGHTGRVTNACDVLNFLERFSRDRGNNAVNHRGRERHVSVNPVCQVGVHRARIRTGHIAHHMAVFRHVIARHHAESR
ncbi:hypothetical protein D3C72_1645480 [compost metagenome]